MKLNIVPLQTVNFQFNTEEVIEKERSKGSFFSKSGESLIAKQIFYIPFAVYRLAESKDSILVRLAFDFDGIFPLAMKSCNVPNDMLVLGRYLSSLLDTLFPTNLIIPEREHLNGIFKENAIIVPQSIDFIPIRIHLNEFLVDQINKFHLAYKKLLNELRYKYQDNAARYGVKVVHDGIYKHAKKHIENQTKRLLKNGLVPEPWQEYAFYLPFLYAKFQSSDKSRNVIFDWQGSKTELVSTINRSNFFESLQTMAIDQILTNGAYNTTTEFWQIVFSASSKEEQNAYSDMLSKIAPQILVRINNLKEQSKQQNLKKYYDILGLQIDATPEEIKTSYRDLLRQYHPDKLPLDATQAVRDLVTQKMRDINEAYHHILNEI